MTLLGIYHPMLTAAVWTVSETLFAATKATSWLKIRFLLEIYLSPFYFFLLNVMHNLSRFRYRHHETSSGSNKLQRVSHA